MEGMLEPSLKQRGLWEKVILECVPGGGGRRGVLLEGGVERGLPLGRVQGRNEGRVGYCHSRNKHLLIPAGLG